MPSLLVTIGTNGQKDWVQLPDGQKFSLGPVSVLSFVSKLTRSSKVAQRTLNAFLKKGEALLSVDDDRMWALLAPHRARWATGPFMPRDREGPTSMIDMRGTFEDLTAIRRVVGHLNALASRGQQDPGAVNRLIRVGCTLAPPVEGPSSDSHDELMRLAKGIVERASITATRIGCLVAEGKRFDASRARADLAAVTTRVASLCSSTQLTEGWVREDLLKLARRSAELHGLFSSKPK